MKIHYIIYLTILSVACKNADRSNNVDIAENFIDSFYSFDRDSLLSNMEFAESSQPNILYYQKWVECAHYKIVKQGILIEKNDSLILCPVTVKDDLMGALEIDFNVTDTFRVSIVDGRIRSVETSSNDPAEYYEAKEWVKKNRPEYVGKQCEGIWEGGPTPCECVQGMIKGFRELRESTKHDPASDFVFVAK